MKFVLLFGPQAVGKMTVGQELEKRTALKLFHNHMTIELLEPYFSFSPDMWRLSTLFRTEIFKAVADSDQEGLIFTYVWAFDQQEDWDFVDQICEIFESKGATVYFVELEADIGERLSRNKSPHRLAHKPTKRNVEWTERELTETYENHRLNSNEGEIQRDHYIRINNTHLTAGEVAKIITERFHL
ncbi:DEAD/DEAH box helicase family protein [Salisediminibacterium beveridgei]|uniref:Shikimate Kinase n=1 Tax=Salisediminibacterium beveridgei TaxID=632773 RepID=A0A1D7QZP8_9BACI|nr:AAA family ATPase [Salisediminibacterium beveridgei]AOM84483.1 Shikimate Kinase [Salisediminibacterium beveridgei]